RHLFVEVAEGVGWLWRQGLMRALVALIGVTNLVFNALPLVLIVRAQQLHAPPAAIGLMFGILGAGAVLGALAAPRVQRRVAARIVLVGAGQRPLGPGDPLPDR